MRVRTAKPPAAQSARAEHREWLSLVEVYGPFLSLDVLQREFPQGLDSHSSLLSRRLRSAYEDWQEQSRDPAYHREWLNFLLEEVLEFPPGTWKEGTEIPPGCQAHFAQHGETLVPDRVLLENEEVRWILSWVPPSQKLDKPLAGRDWVADPIWRMVELLHATGHPLGLVSNGEHIAVVSAPLGEPSGVANFYVELWLEEPLTFRAFRTLFGIRRFFSASPESTPEALLRQSAQEQHTVTTALGKQVLQAVELLVSDIDRLDRGSQGELLKGVDERTLFRAALTVMMRLIFLLSAEERGLLPLKNQFYQENYAISPLAQMLREVADRHGEELLTRREDAWVRLFATFRAVYAGVQHEDLHLPAYGGSLFDPDQFAFLEGRPVGSSWKNTAAVPLLLHNRLVLYLLESLQTLKEKGEVARRVSFRALDVEQLGHVYESLLDHTVKRSSSAVLGLKGKAGKEPEIELFLLQDSPDAALKALAEATGRKTTELVKDIVYDTPHDNPFLRDRCEDLRLYQQVLPFQKLLRDDAMGQSVICPPGGAYVTSSSERRESGAHYTPRSLTDEMVQHTLDPLIYPGMNEGIEPGPERLLRPENILSLKVLDLAMGSGAFLVQVCRYLAERLVESWQRYGSPPDLPHEPDARLAIARRQVAERCLFGVDRDPLAVEMAKLSVWLLTLDQQKPFSFLDHALRCGDSLLGLTSVEQLRQLRLDPVSVNVTPRLSQQQVDEALQKSRQARTKLESFAVVDPRDADEKTALLRVADSATVELRRYANLVIAASLQTAGGKGFDNRLDEMIAQSDPPVQRWLNGAKPDSAPDRQPFHWIIEFPEVFDQGGFDAIVGNPPFLGGKKITGALGDDYRDFLLAFLADGQRGSADLVAYFFLRAGSIIKRSGHLGLVATNTLAQGDTREVGLDRLTQGGITLYKACASRQWPGGAALEVAQVWGSRADWSAGGVISGSRVLGITPSLTAQSRLSGNPHRLLANAKRAYIGSFVLGMGFVLDSDSAGRLVERDSRNREVLFPFLNGEDLTTRPDQSPSRWVINFHDWPLERAQTYAEVFSIIEERVRPERQRVDERGDFVLRKPLPDRWWQYADKRPELYRLLSGLKRAIAVPLVSKFAIFSWQETDKVFSHALGIIATEDWGVFAVVQSTLHEEWARTHGSTLETRMRYTPSDCFETFPFPDTCDSLHDIAIQVDQHRQEMCLDRAEGLTKILNRVHDRGDLSSDVQQMRALLGTLDHKVAVCYGWSDLDMGHAFEMTALGPRFTVNPAMRLELLDRLLERNQAHYADEVRMGYHTKKSSARSRKRDENAPRDICPIKTQLPLFKNEIASAQPPRYCSPPVRTIRKEPAEVGMSEEEWEKIRHIAKISSASVTPSLRNPAQPITPSTHQYDLEHRGGHAKAASTGSENQSAQLVDDVLAKEQKSVYERTHRDAPDQQTDH